MLCSLQEQTADVDLCAVLRCAGCRASRWVRLSRTQVLVSTSARRSSATGMIVLVQSVWVTSGMKALAPRSLP
jgi:hypothetical protein